MSDTVTRYGEGAGFAQIDPMGRVVATCHWHGCDEPAPFAITVGLVPPGSRVARAPFAVPLCRKHRGEAISTGRINLAYHPDDRLDQ